MNPVPIIFAGALGVGVGVLGTSIFYRNKIEEKIQVEIDSFKETYKVNILSASSVQYEGQTPSIVEDKPVSNDIPVPVRTQLDNTSMVRYDQVKHPYSPSEEVEIDVEINEGFIDPHDFDDQEDEPSVDVLSFEEFLDSETSYPQVTLMYRSDEGKVYDEDEIEVPDVAHVIGAEALLKLTNARIAIDDSIYVINHLRQTVYEVYYVE